MHNEVMPIESVAVGGAEVKSDPGLRETRLRQLTAYARLAAVAVALVGIIVLFGWYFDVPVLRSVFPGWTSMKPNTASMLIVLSMGVWSATFQGSRRALLIGRSSACLAVLVGGMTFGEYLLQTDFGVDLILPFEHQRTEQVLFPGRMAPATAFSLLLSGLSLLLARTLLWSQVFLVSSLFISLTALIGYLFDVSALYTVGMYSSMAIHTAAALILLNTGFLVTQQESGLVELLVAETAGGSAGRSLLVSVPLVVLCIGSTLLAGEAQGYYDNRFSLALMATLSISALVAVILRTADHLHRVDISRAQSQQELATLNAVLEARVAERTCELAETNNRLMEEIQQRQKIEDEVRRLSLTDELTGLHNRRSFFILADQQLRVARRNGRPCLLFFIDLDGLKRTNDIHGHEAGDLVIVAAAKVLKEAFRESDIVARIGGDEFVALAVDAGEPADGICARIQALVDEFNGGDYCQYPIGLSIGAVGCSPKELKPLGELLASADALMYADKQRRRRTPAL